MPAQTGSDPPAPPPGASAVLTVGSLGAIPGRDGTTFRVIAPSARQVLLHLAPGAAPLPLDMLSEGVFGASVPGVRPGDLYQLQVDQAPLMPDPASRFQPQGVHGPSEVTDPAFDWTDAGWRGPDPRALRIYELHVGAFTPEGSFDAVAAKLPRLAGLGVNAVELMPIGDFPGCRNWGYDPGALFAPAHCYGRPRELRRLVDEAHRLGLAVLLDVVYNNLGPDGAYLPVFMPDFFSKDREGPWGKAVNLDGPGSGWVRWYLVENARYWVREFHLDGLRLDATHALIDRSPRHVLQDLADGIHAEGLAAGRRTLAIAEDERNLARIVRARDHDGFGLDAVWADDFHHQVRSATAGDNDGYYGDYTGSAADIATTARRGWFYTGQVSRHARRPRGTDPAGLPPERFVFCIQNHDQVGNRAMGERLNQQIGLPSYLAASLLLLALPETPLLFMGQEWAAGTPFLFFTDHGEELGRLVTEGRRREFAAFAGFADEAAREKIPDPQAAETFETSRLRWDEAESDPHAGVLRFYRAALALRAGHPLLHTSAPLEVNAVDEGCLLVRRGRAWGEASRLAAVVRLTGAGRVEVAAGPGPYSTLLSSEDPSFLGAVTPIEWEALPDADGQRGRLAVTFARPGGIILEAGR